MRFGLLLQQSADSLKGEAPSIWEHPVDWFNAAFAWVTMPIGVAIVLAIGVVATMLFAFAPGWVANWRLRKGARIPLDGEWISEYNTMTTDTGNSAAGNWRCDQVKVTLKSGKYVFDGTTSTDGFPWKAEAELFHGDYVYGKWWSTGTGSSHGVMCFQLSTGGEMLYGYYVGRNSGPKAGDDRIGQWVLAHNKDGQGAARIAEAKSLLTSQGFLFRSDVLVEPIRAPWYSAHLTQIKGQDTWRHHVLDFSKTSEPYLLTTTMEVLDNKGKMATYDIECGHRGPHLLMFYKPRGSNEKESVAMFPFFRQHGDNYGVISGTNWDGDQFLGKAWLSPEPIHDLKGSGSADASMKLILDEQWNTSFLQRNKVPGDAFSFERKSVTLGIDGVYSSVAEHLKGRDASSPKLDLTVLGYMLFSVEDPLLEWHERGLLVNLHLRLMHLDSAFLSASKHFEPTWPGLLEKSLERLGAFVSGHADKLREAGVTIEFVPYAHLPAVHGFGIAGKVYFVAFAQWEKNGKLKLPSDAVFAEVNSNDKGLRATLRELFKNWVQSARAFPKQ